MTAQRASSDPSTRRQDGPAPSSSRKPILIAVGVLAAGLLAAVVVALAAGGDSASVTAGNPAAHLPAEPSDQVASVQLSGDPLPRFESAIADLAQGMRSPAIAASYFDGSPAQVTPGDGTPKVLLFLAHWCSHCQAEVASLTDWFETNGVPTDVDIVAVSTGVDSGAPNYPPSSWLLEENWPTAVLRDSSSGEIATAFGLTGFPFVAAVDGEGAVVSRSSGGLPITAWENLLAVLAET